MKMIWNSNFSVHKSNWLGTQPHPLFWALPRSAVKAQRQIWVVSTEMVGSTWSEVLSSSLQIKFTNPWPWSLGNAPHWSLLLEKHNSWQPHEGCKRPSSTQEGCRKWWLSWAQDFPKLMWPWNPLLTPGVQTSCTTHWCSSHHQHDAKVQKCQQIQH